MRINHPDTDEGKADLQAICSAAPFPAGVMIPKISSAEELQRVDQQLSSGGCDGRLFILIETNAGLQACFDILRASSRLGMVLFGGVDLARPCAAHRPGSRCYMPARGWFMPPPVQLLILWICPI